MKDSNEETHPLFYLSCLCVNLYFLSPLLSFIKFYRMKEERNDEWKFLPGIQIFAVLINCMFWIVSGESSDDDNMSIVNVIGLIIALFFVFIYWTSAFNGKFKEYFINRAGECKNGLYPTVSIRQIMWALKIKPIKRERWETCFDRREI